MSRLLPSVFLLTAVLAAPGAFAHEAAPGPLLKTMTASNGQAIALPQGPVEVTSAITEVAAGALTPVHMHPYPRYGYVLEGRVEVTYLDTGEKKVFETGQMFVDPVGIWHQGRALDGKRVLMLTIDQTPPGKSNLTLQDAAKAAP